MKLKIKRFDDKAVIPSYSKVGDAGLDLTAISKIYNNKYVEFGTGLGIEIPEGHVGLIFPRSSVTSKDLILKNSVGVIDSNYRGEIKLRFFKVTEDNPHSFVHDYGGYDIGDRVGQLVIMPIPYIEFEEVEELSDTTRGEGGFGSTGK